LDKLGEYLGTVMLQYDQKSEKRLTYSPMKYIYDYKAMKRYGIDENDIPDDAEIINVPHSFIESHKRDFFALLISSIVVVVFIFLIYRQFVIRSANVDLVKVKDELKLRNRELQYLSVTDPLTGLRNRRAIEEAITEEIHRSKRYGDPISLLILDLDMFKKINDAYGHSVGDKVLEKVARIITESIRMTDKASRWGGEEFLVLAVNTCLKNALIVAERIRKNVMGIEVENIKKITASIGVAEYVKEEEFLKWYERADAALYKAKESGRNKVIGEEGKE